MYWFLAVLKKYAVFTGRARRKEYWMFVLFSIIFFILAQLIDAALGTRWHIMLTPGVAQPMPMQQGWVYFSLALFLFVPGIAVAVRRLHDIGKSGWWYLWLNIPSIIMTILAFFIVRTFGLLPGDKVSTNYLPIKGLALACFAVAFIVALICTIWYIVWLARKGQQGSNKYGPDPLEPESESEKV